MNKIFKISQGILVLTMLLCSSCMKDHPEDYKKDQVADFQFDNALKDAYLANVGDVLSLEAKITAPANPSLTYKWYYYSAAANSTVTRVNVGTAPKLDLNINMETGAYYLVAEVTDTNTGVKGYKKIALTVKRLTSEGWLLLTWKNNQANLSIVSSANEVLKNFLKPSATYPITSKPENLICINDWDAKSQPIIIKTAQPNVYFLDYNTFDVHNDARDAFKSGLNPPITHFGTDMYNNVFYMWDNNGLVYQVNRSAPVNYPAGFDQPMQGTYKAAKFVLPVSSGYPVPSVFYDEQAKRFLYQDYGGNVLKPFQAKPASAPFDMNNFPDQIVYTDNGASDMTYVIGKNTSGEHRLYTLALNDALNTYPAMAADKLDIPNNAAPSFYTISGKLPLLYYIVNNNLYLYKMGEKRSMLLYTFPADESVSALKMLRGTAWFTSSNNPNVENLLGIAVNTTAGGVLYTFELSATGALKTGKYTTRNDGFDPIVDIAYKMQK